MAKCGGPGHRHGGLGLGCKRTETEIGHWTAACRDTGDQGQGVGDQERDTARPGCRGRCMGRWGWELRRPGSAPGEPGDRASGQGHEELGQGHRGAVGHRRSTGTSTGTWSNQDAGDQDRNMVLGQGHRRPGPREGDEEQETGSRTCVVGPGQEHRRLKPGQGHWDHTMGDRDMDTGGNGRDMEDWDRDMRDMGTS